MNNLDRRARLSWLALPLAAFVLLAGLVGHTPDSQALNPYAEDLNVTKTATPTRLLPGEAVDYTATFSNSGQLTATLTVISDTLDPSLTFVQMLPGSDITATPSVSGNVLSWAGPFTLPVASELIVKYQVETSTAAGWHYPCNEVAALAGGELVGPAHACVEVGPAEASVYLPVVFRNVRWARFTIAKSVTPIEVDAAPNQVVTYTVTIANIGDKPGKLAAVVDTLPAGFTYLDMAAGSDVTADPTGTTGLIRWNGPFNIAGGGQLRLIYKVTASQTPGQYTNSANVETLIGKPPAGPASATVTVRQSILLEEDFNDGISGWTEFLNHHRLTAGQWYWGEADGPDGSGALTHDALHVYPKVAADGLMMYLAEGAEQWTNYRVETMMKLTGGVNGQGVYDPKAGDPIGLWVRGTYQDSDIESQWVSGYYVVVLGDPDRNVHFARIVKMQQPGDCDACLKPFRMYNFDNPVEKAIVELPGPYVRSQWYHLAVEVRDANIKVFVDGALVLEWTDPLLPFMTGTVGLKVHETKNGIFDDLIVTSLP